MRSPSALVFKSQTLPHIDDLVVHIVSYCRHAVEYQHEDHISQCIRGQLQSTRMDMRHPHLTGTVPQDAFLSQWMNLDDYMCNLPAAHESSVVEHHQPLVSDYNDGPQLLVLVTQY